MLRTQLLGRPRFWVGQLELVNLSSKATLLLAYLCCVQRPVPRLMLERLLWDKDGTQNIRQALRRLKQLEGADSWLIVAPEVALIASNDLQGVYAALEQERFEMALQGLRQPLLDFDFDLPESFGQWWQLEQRRWSDLREDTLQKLVTRAEMQGDFERAVAFQTELCSFDLLSETRYRHLIHLHLQREDRTAALEVFETLRRNLTEFGAEPLEETRALLQTRNSKLSARVAEAIAVLGVPDGVSELERRDVVVIAVMLEVPAVDVIEVLSHDNGAPMDQPDLHNLPEPTKCWLHQRAAIVLETRGEALPRIARHQLEAGLVQQAVLNNLKAGRVALRERGSKVAFELGRRAFEGLDRLDSNQFQLRLEVILFVVGVALKRSDSSFVEQAQAALLALARASQRDEHWFEAHLNRAQIAVTFGDFVAASTATDEALKVVTRLQRAGAGVSNWFERAALTQALIAVHTQQPDALEQLEQLLPSSQLEVRVRALNAYSALKGIRGEFKMAQAALEQSLTLARAGEALDVVAQTLSNLGTLTQQLGDLQRSESHWREALELWRCLEHPAGEVMILGNLATMHLERGAYGFAWSSAEEALELAERAGLVLPQLLALRTLATLELRFDRPGIALEYLTRHQQLAVQTQNQRLHRVGEVMQKIVHAFETPDEPALSVIDDLTNLEREGLGNYAQVMRAWLCLGVREDSTQQKLIEQLESIDNAHYQLIRTIAQGIFAVRHGGDQTLIEPLETALQAYPSEWRALGYSVLSQLFECAGEVKRSTRAMVTARAFRAEQLEGLPESRRHALERSKL
jgi:DNA-binding SARP family transcriptional activator/tetratricopeptide (TPR) repeat protein